ncbi:MAG TPA: D-alanyl-D-alanine carboxypeptidase family protein [Mycobacterium sp.]|nr:D-alanyl-D-alanine carboxypeptidase family protein [Mycobacterium sp.]
MRKLVILIAAVLMAYGLSTPVAFADPAPVGTVAIPDGPAQAWLVADMDTGQILTGRNEYGQYAPASTIKVLLALTVLNDLSLDQTITATKADTAVECNCAGVEPGRSYTVRQLLPALLLVSGNDAANTLATGLGGQEQAVAKMNAMAALLGAYGTNAGSPSGLDGPGIPMWTSPHDLAVIFRAAMANPVFAQITSMPTAVFPTKTGDTVLVNQDELLKRYPGALGGKTGYTNIARKTFVGAAQRGDRRLIVVTMFGLDTAGAPTNWDQAMRLLDWGFAQSPQTSVGAL